MMYPKLAFDNIRKNARIYLPYILTCMLMIAMFYIMKSLSLNEGLNGIFGAQTTAYILGLGTYVIGIFAFIFLFYTNSFLLKQRKKEFGLYNILGMEKRHIAKMLGYESLYVTLLSFVGGLGSGILLDKLMYVVVSRLVGVEVQLGFYISVKAIQTTLLLFGIVFVLIFLNSMRMIHLSQPIELLKGGSVGEREPKAKWLIALLGILCLGSGYYISLTIQNPLLALSLFFVAVLLVIFGTYLLFTAGSIALLKLLKKSKRYYYQTKHFISVSGMMYRMKQNAVGLANICILSTMVLVMASSTTSLLVGVEEILREHYPYQIELQQQCKTGDTSDVIAETVRSLAAEQEIAITDVESHKNIQFQMIVDGDTLRAGAGSDDFSRLANVRNVFAITAADYTAYTGDPVTLAEHEVLLWGNREPYALSYFNIFGERFEVQRSTEKFIENIAMNADICPTMGIVVKDITVIEMLYQEQAAVYGKNASHLIWFYGLNIDGDEAQQKHFYTLLSERLRNQSIHVTMKCRAEQKTGLYALYGGLFFLGIFLGLLFTMATVLIIYYKQISEGYDDQSRFEIMQKVGMSEQEVKHAIHSQVLTVFFLPLMMAGLHTAVAFPIVRKILTMLQMTNAKLFAMSNICVFLAFTAIYVVIYLLTAHAYYKIVRT